MKFLKRFWIWLLIAGLAPAAVVWAVGSPMTKANFDQSTDDPVQAFSELADNVDIYNTLQGSLKTVSTLTIGDGVKDDGLGNLDLDLSTDSGLEIASAKLRVKAIEGIQRKASDAGLALDVNGLTQETTIDSVSDFLAVYDASAGTHRKANPRDVLGANIASQAEAEAGTDNIKTMTPLRTAQSWNVALSKVFTTSGTYDVPPGVTVVLVEAIGAGGGGGGCSIPSCAGGGGGSGEKIVAVVTVTGGGSETITIGAGGTGGAGASNGSNGGDSTFGTKVTAKGGLGGTTGGTGTGGSGGSGSSTTGTGLKIITSHAGVAGAGQTGGVGAGIPDDWNGTKGGGGASGGDGSLPGAGGGGGNGAPVTSGGDGANGLIIVTPLK